MERREFDWQAYVLGELTPAEREQAAAYLAAHPEARAEVEELEMTLHALQRLPQVEPVRRIAFVSDPVLEPSWWRQWWASGPRMAFAGAAMLSLAILVHAVVAPPRGGAPGDGMTAADVRAVVDQAVAQERARFDQVKAEILEQARAEREADLEMVRESFVIMEKRLAAAQSLAVRYGGD
jgi:anti-sigma factor RsiW